MSTVLDLLIERVNGARTAASGAQIAPVALLWPDHNREWERVVPIVAHRVEVLRFGDYHPEELIGPAVWLRCLIAGTLDVLRPLKAGQPVVYLAGVGRDDLRAVDECTDSLKPLAELSSSQRATVFGHPNGRDWKLHGWLTNKERGAGLTVGGDNATLEALADAVEILLEQPLEIARGRNWGAASARTTGPMCGIDSPRPLLYTQVSKGACARPLPHLLPATRDLGLISTSGGRIVCGRS